MNTPYVRFQSLRSFIDGPILLLCMWWGQLLFPGNELKENQPFSYLFLVLLLVSWYLAAQITKIYSDLRTNKFSEEIVYIASTVSLHAIFLTSLLFFFRADVSFSNFFLLFYLLSVFLLVIITKYILRKYLHHSIYQGKLSEKVLLIGSTPAAQNFIETIERHAYYGYQCLGFLDNEKKELNGCKYFGKIADLKKIIETQEVDEVIIALPNSAHEEIKYSIEICDHLAKRARIIPDLYFYASSNIQINTIGLLPVINLRSLPQDRFGNRLLKRTFDILFAACFFLFIAWWLFPIIALLIKLSSKGPVYFKQERWGLNNELIICYKFRTMLHGSPQLDHEGKLIQSSRNDERVTTIGKYLRKFNLDELPQFWNVLKGDMSVVGPRPHPTPLNKSAIVEVQYYLLRHLVKPGITGWAQVNGSRGEMVSKNEIEERINYDLYYIHRWTFRLDCWIILQTVVNLIRGDDRAY
jgi:putative colanic acid biosynthesis UDP-glucose lipid carrier transferase